MNIKLPLFLLLITCSQWATGQEILGVVTDMHKEPLVNVSVTVKQGGIEKARSVTDFDGRYSIKPLDPGYYDVTISYINYKTTTVTSVIATPWEKTALNFTVEQGASEEKVVKQYKKPLIHHRQGQETPVTSNYYGTYYPGSNKRHNVDMPAGRSIAPQPIHFSIINTTPAPKDAPLYVINNVKVKYDVGIYNHHIMLADADYRNIMFSRMRWSSKYEDHFQLVLQ